MAVTFFAALARMKYIDRWALMRASRRENLSEHAAEVAILAHALCEIGNLRHGRQLNAERAAVIGLFHDASEIITGDMPTPVKYGSEALRKAYHAAEERATESLLARLPKELAEVYAPLLGVVTAAEAGGAEELYLWRLVKAADKLSAYIKCLEEESAGNTEFRTAKRSIEAELKRVKACGGNPHKIFLGDGCAFSLQTEKLLTILDSIHSYFPNDVKIHSDATVSSILSNG